MIIGRFAESAEGGFVGHIRTMFFKSDKVVIEPAAGAGGAAKKLPDFRVYTGDEIELGAAWTKRSKDGLAYYELRLDDPTFVQPVQCRLVQAKGRPGLILIWERPKTAKAA